MLSMPYFERAPDPSLVAEQGGKYNYLAATRGEKYGIVPAMEAGRKSVNFLIKECGDLPLPADPLMGMTGCWCWMLINNKMMRNLLIGLLFFTSCTAGKNVYLFTSFREPATDGLYFLSSPGGYHWTDLGGPWLRPAIGEKKLMRDPSMAQGADGVWRLVWTSGWNGDKGFGYASSEEQSPAVLHYYPGF
jgi:hypothetical protein